MAREVVKTINNYELLNVSVPPEFLIEVTNLHIDEYPNFLFLEKLPDIARFFQSASKFIVEELKISSQSSTNTPYQTY